MAEQMSQHDARQVYGHKETLCMQACVHAIFNIHIIIRIYSTYIRYAVTKRACLTVRRAAHTYNLCITWYQLCRPLFSPPTLHTPFLSSHAPHPLTPLPHSTPPYPPPTLHTPSLSFHTPCSLTLLPHLMMKISAHFHIYLVTFKISAALADVSPRTPCACTLTHSTQPVNIRMTVPWTDTYICTHGTCTKNRE